jgi:hypothetical protein
MACGMCSMWYVVWHCGMLRIRMRDARCEVMRARARRAPASRPKPKTKTKETRNAQQQVRRPFFWARRARGQRPSNYYDITTRPSGICATAHAVPGIGGSQPRWRSGAPRPEGRGRAGRLSARRGRTPGRGIPPPVWAIRRASASAQSTAPRPTGSLRPSDAYVAPKDLLQRTQGKETMLRKRMRRPPYGLRGGGEFFVVRVPKSGRE